MAAAAPAWTRWLPCSVAHLKVVADQDRFPHRLWDTLPVPWDSPVWCDPGDVADWIARAQQAHLPEEADEAEQHARARYDQIVEARSARITLFTDMCRRADLATPCTVRELLTCLVGFGLFELEHDDGELWVRPRLFRNPLDVLPFTEDEAADEARAQCVDRAIGTAIALRQLAEKGGEQGGEHRTVSITLPALAAEAGLSTGQLRHALGFLIEIRQVELGADPTTVAADAPLTVRLEWPDFAYQFPFDELPAPEHAL